MKNEGVCYEPIEFEAIIPNGVFYLVNPQEYPNAMPHYACENLPADQIVWTVWFAWQRSNPWIKKEYRSFIHGNQLAGLINAANSDFTLNTVRDEE